MLNLKMSYVQAIDKLAWAQKASFYSTSSLTQPYEKPSISESTRYRLMNIWLYIFRLHFFW